MAREYELAPKRPPGLSTEEVGKNGAKNSCDATAAS